MIAFDHANSENCFGLKYITCKPADFEVLAKQPDLLAAKTLLKSNHNLVFVHISNDAWNLLMEKGRSENVIIRFSTSPFPPQKPQGVKALGLHCIKGLNELSPDDIIKLITVLSNPDYISSLRGEKIPTLIQHLIRFDEPHLIRSLHILLQGVLANWASDQRDQNRCTYAKKYLDLHVSPPSFNPDILKHNTLCRGLGLVTENMDINQKYIEEFYKAVLHELGIETIEENLPVKNLLDHICYNSKDIMLDETTVFRGFDAIDTFLRN